MKAEKYSDLIYSLNVNLNYSWIDLPGILYANFLLFIPLHTGTGSIFASDSLERRCLLKYQTLAINI
jgi:hypothetical protein